MRDLENKGYKIQVDSTYQSYKDPLEILYQEPEAGASVKIGRTLFLTVNRKSVPTVPMPNLRNLSFRNAILTMNSFRLEMGDTLYRPDVAAGAVLEQWYEGRQIMPGSPVPYGARITLVIGEGLADMQEVPNLIGLTWMEARQKLNEMSISVNALFEGAITDTQSAIIYKQIPESVNELDFPEKILTGDIMDVYVMQNPSPRLLKMNQPGSRKLIEDIDSIEIETKNSASNTITEPSTASPKKRDTILKKVGSGTAAPSKTENKSTEDKKKTQDDVKPIPKPKPAIANTPPPKPKEKPSVKKSDDQISNEYE